MHLLYFSVVSSVGEHPTCVQFPCWCEKVYPPSLVCFRSKRQLLHGSGWQIKKSGSKKGRSMLFAAASFARRGAGIDVNTKNTVAIRRRRRQHPKGPPVRWSSVGSRTWVLVFVYRTFLLNKVYENIYSIYIVKITVPRSHYIGDM